MKLALNLVLCLSLFLPASGVIAQTAHTLKSFKVSVNGTSTLHDWTSDVTEVKWTGQLQVDGNSVKAVKGVEVTIPVKSIKSKEGKTMDNKTYDAFNADKNPTITFKLTSATVVGAKVTAKGNVTMNGVTKPITMNLDAETSPGEVTLSGSQKVNMKDHNMTPPKAVLGTIKVGPEVTILFELVLSPQ